MASFCSDFSFSLSYENDCPILSKQVSNGRGDHHSIYKCKMCQYKSFTKINLMTHYRSHVLPQFPHKCPVCSLGFERIDAMRSHLNIHREGPTPWSLLEVQLNDSTSSVPSTSTVSSSVSTAPQQPFKRCKLSGQSGNKVSSETMVPLEPKRRLRKTPTKTVYPDDSDDSDDEYDEKIKWMMLMSCSMQTQLQNTLLNIFQASLATILVLFPELLKNQSANNRK